MNKFDAIEDNELFKPIEQENIQRQKVDIKKDITVCSACGTSSIQIAVDQTLWYICIKCKKKWSKYTYAQ